MSSDVVIGAPHAARNGVRPPRLVVSDLDGTFLLPDGSVSEASRAVLARARDAGLRVIFATGRPPRWLDVVAGLPMIDPVVVASNGALLWDLSAGAAVRRHDVPGDVALEVVQELRAAVPGTAFAVEQGLRFGFEANYQTWMNLEDIGGDARFFSAPAETLVTEPFVKLLVQHTALGAEELAAVAGRIVGDRLTVTHSAFGGVGLLEVSAPGVTKATMIDEYATSLDITAAEVAAFGDMPNDLDMLQWAGLPHVMASAHPALAAVPAVQIGSNVDSAVAATIDGWLA
ncbi:HAD family hydrolase [Mariniluteicoccus flavus]